MLHTAADAVSESRMPRRRRLIDEAVLSSPDLLPLKATGRLFWIGLLLVADENGLCRSCERYLKNKCLPLLRLGRVSLMSYVRYFIDNGMLCERDIDGVKYYQITNWRKYQRLYRPRDEMIGDDRRGGERKRAPPRPPEPPEEETAEEPGMALFMELGLTGTKAPDALNACRRFKYTPEDLADWRDYWRQAIEQTRVDDIRKRLNHAPSFVRSQMLLFKNPKDSGVSWYTPKPKDQGDKSKAIALLRKRVGETIAVNGDEWKVEDNGVYGPRGFRLFGALGVKELERLSGAEA